MNSRKKVPKSRRKTNIALNSLCSPMIDLVIQESDVNNPFFASEHDKFVFFCCSSQGTAGISLYFLRSASGLSQKRKTIFGNYPLRAFMRNINFWWLLARFFFLFASSAHNYFNNILLWNDMKLPDDTQENHLMGKPARHGEWRRLANLTKMRISGNRTQL